MPFSIVSSSIVKLHVDAVVNAANTALAEGGGVCGAIFAAAGQRELSAACNALAPVAVGHAAVTPGFALSAKYVIHAVGPVYEQARAAECEANLYSAYTVSLTLAREHGCRSIAFPLISSGIYGYPHTEALAVATRAIRDFIDRDGADDIDVYLAIVDRASFDVGRDLSYRIDNYVDEFFVSTRADKKPGMYNCKCCGMAAEVCNKDTEELSCDAAYAADESVSFGTGSVDDALGQLDEPFSATLLRLIDSKNMTDVQVYKRANLDRRHFSKIRTGRDYVPGKRTVLALAVALSLSLSETVSLLGCAGYSLSHSRKADVIVEYFIVNGRYDVYEINEALFKYDQPLLGA